MAQAPRDENKVPTILAVSNADGETTLSVFVNPTNHSIKVDNDTGGSDLTGDIGKRDQNKVVGWMGVSSSDGITPVPVYVDSSNNELLIDST